MKKLFILLIAAFYLPGCATQLVTSRLPTGETPVPLEKIIAQFPAELPRPEIFAESDKGRITNEFVTTNPVERNSAAMLVESLAGIYIKKSNKIYIRDYVKDDAPLYDYVVVHETAHATANKYKRAYFHATSKEPKTATQQWTQEEIIAELTTYLIFGEAGLEKPVGDEYIEKIAEFRGQHIKRSELNLLYPQAIEAAGYLLGHEPRAVLEFNGIDEEKEEN